jgi:hypothetical protein
MIVVLPNVMLCWVVNYMFKTEWYEHIAAAPPSEIVRVELCSLTGIIGVRVY